MSIETLNYIGGKWVSSASGETRDACDPPLALPGRPLTTKVGRLPQVFNEPKY